MGFALEGYTAVTFEPYRGVEFTFERGAGPSGGGMPPARLELLEVSRHDRIAEVEPASFGSGSPCRRAPFSLLFALRDQAALESGLHRLLHPDFEPCELFVNRVFVPGRGAGTATLAYYEAVFA